MIQGFWLEQLGRVEVLLSEIGRVRGADSRDGKNPEAGELPGSPAVRTPRFHCQGLGSISGLEAKIPQAAQHSRGKK